MCFFFLFNFHAQILVSINNWRICWRGCRIKLRYLIGVHSRWMKRLCFAVFIDYLTYSCSGQRLNKILSTEIDDGSIINISRNEIGGAERLTLNVWRWTNEAEQFALKEWSWTIDGERMTLTLTDNWSDTFSWLTQFVSELSLLKNGDCFSSRYSISLQRKD